MEQQIRKIVKQEIDIRENNLLKYLDKKFTEIDKKFTELDKKFTELKEDFNNKINNLNNKINEIEKIVNKNSKSLGLAVELFLGVPLLEFKGKIIKNKNNIFNASKTEIKNFTLYLSENTKTFYNKKGESIAQIDAIYTDGKENPETVLFMEIKTSLTAGKYNEIKSKIKTVINEYLKEQPQVKTIFYGIGYITIDKEVKDKAKKQGLLLIKLKEQQKEIEYENKTATAIII